MQWKINIKPLGDKTKWNNIKNVKVIQNAELIKNGDDKSWLVEENNKGKIKL